MEESTVVESVENKTEEKSKRELFIDGVKNAIAFKTKKQFGVAYKKERKRKNKEQKKSRKNNRKK